MEKKQFIRSYKEGKKYYVIFGDVDSFMGASEKEFDSKKEMDEFIKKYLFI